jgi:hypothetical protein
MSTLWIEMPAPGQRNRGSDSGYDPMVLRPDDVNNRCFRELWDVFLHWRVAALEWPLSPKVVFEEVEPVEDLHPIFQPLVDQRWIAIERLLRNPDPDISLAFTEGYRHYLLGMDNKKLDGEWYERPSAEWWEGHIDRWLRTFLSNAVAHVPPNYRTNQLLLFPYDGIEPLKGTPPVESARQ